MSLSKQQLIKNSGWTLLELVSYPVLMIAATPLFIHRLGIEQYGLWMLINAITLGMNVLNIGIGDTNIRLIAKFRAHDDFQSIKRVFHFNFSLAIGLCLFSALLGLLFYFTCFISLFYKGVNLYFANSILLLACLSAGIRFIEISLVSVFKGFERFDLNSKLMLISKNATMLVSLALVWRNYDLVAVFIGTVMMNLLNVTLQAFVVMRYKPGIFTTPSFIFLTQKLDRLNYHVWYWLQSVIALVGFLADKFIIALVADVSTLGYYSIATLIGSQIHNFFLAFGSFVFPRVAFKLSVKSNITPLYFLARCMVVLPGWGIILFLLFFQELIFRSWLGPETYGHSIFFIRMYLVFEAVMLLIIVPFYFINGTRFVKLNSFFEILIRLSHVVAMLFGYYLAGVNGIVYGLVIASLLNIPLQYYYFHKKVLGGHFGPGFMWVVFPVFCIFGLLVTENVFFQVSLILCFILSCKFIYIDPAKRHSTWRLRPALFGPGQGG